MNIFGSIWNGKVDFEPPSNNIQYQLSFTLGHQHGQSVQPQLGDTLGPLKRVFHKDLTKSPSPF